MDPEGHEEISRMLKDIMRVNALIFCKHGHEYCNHCMEDNRSTNNEQLCGSAGSLSARMSYQIEGLGNGPEEERHEEKLRESMRAILQRRVRAPNSGVII